jgi:hypothetical protein
MRNCAGVAIIAVLTGPSLLVAADKTDFSKLDLSKLPRATEKKDISFPKDIQPLFEASCVRCHGEDRPKGGLRLNSLEGVLNGGKDGKVVAPGDSAKSLLVIAAAQIDEDTAMPPKRGPGRGGPRGGPGGPAGPGGSGGQNRPDQFGSSPNGGPNSDHGGGPPPGPRGGPGGFGPPPKPLTAEQVGLVRAWIDQGAK